MRAETYVSRKSFVTVALFDQNLNTSKYYYKSPVWNSSKIQSAIFALVHPKSQQAHLCNI